ncbi:LptA/OstA family protein [Lentilitoribacter sp. Alg239-R112]|uniref:LptA/OstA family protein n=1 Tax=Lentilitoribacter sp. Alg239-R112 TaxID=2305987 RepID=UPI0013A6E7C8|nr:LptA/OstA family protein [Lentilitoribacter sp. Alg239-R112]
MKFHSPSNSRLKVVITCLVSFLFIGWAQAQNVNSNIGGLALSNDQPIQIESNQLDVNDSKAEATFTGNVKVVQGETLLRASRMVVHYTQGSSVTSGAADFEKINVFGKVLLKSGTQTATADKGTIDMLADTLVLSGKEVVLTEGDNVFVGCKLTVQMASGNARLDSCGKRVILQLDPKSQKK